MVVRGWGGGGVRGGRREGDGVNGEDDGDRGNNKNKKS